MKFDRRTKWFKALCSERSEKLALFIYARARKLVSSGRRDRFYSILYKSVKHATTEKDAEDRFYATEGRILRNHRHFSYRMWEFCGKAVMRISHQIGAMRINNRGGVRFSEFPVLRRRLFSILRKAGNDADVNKQVDDFSKQICLELASSSTTTAASV